jgi:hypothetical protein
MNVNLTAVLVLIGFVVPGLSARRTRNLFYPRKLDPVGPTEELGQFVATGLLIHLILLSGCLLFFSLWQRPYGHEVGNELTSGGLPSVITEHYWFTISYLAASLVSGHLYGALSGFAGVRRGVRGLFAPLLRKAGVSLLVDLPMVFDVFHQEGFSGITFVELEMKGDGGYYTGQLAEYALVPDAEPHKPVYLEKVLFRSAEDSTYHPIDADGVWFDLADAVSVRIKRMSETDLKQAEDQTEG